MQSVEAQSSPGSDLGLAILLCTQSQIQHQLPQLSSRFIADGDLGFGVELILRPVLLNEETQSTQSSLSHVRLDRGVAGDVGEGDGESRIRAGPLKVNLGLLAWSLLGKLRIGQQLDELILHLDGRSTR